jgi:glycosyltransferase involved in cell wall biosynthesis
VLIFYDWFGAVGGAEKAILALASGLNADVVSTDVNPACSTLAGYPDVRIRSLGPTPNLAILKQVAATWRFSRAKPAGDYDVFLFGGSFAPYATVHHRPSLWYCFSPTRTFFDLREKVWRQQKNSLRRSVFSAWTWSHRGFERWAARKIDVIIAISKNVQGRIHKAYNRDAQVIYPPVDISGFRHLGYGDFWLSVNRLYPEKRIELQIEAFRRMPEQQLIIVGGHSRGGSAYSAGLLAGLPPNVQWLGQIPEDKLRELYGHCRGHITTALDEDFGLTPVEAMACGKPVVAPAEGGYLETVIDGVTGRLVDATNIEHLVAAIRGLSRDPQQYSAACVGQAQKFDVKRFIGEMRTEIEDLAVGHTTHD